MVLSALQYRDFRLLWTGQSVSVVGDALVIVAIGLFVTRLTGDPGDVGLVLASYALPLILFLLIGGVLADRLPRRLVMITTDVVRAAAHAVLALLVATDVVRVWHMVVIGFVFGTAQAFFQPAYTGLVPQTVPESQIQSAQALGGISRELATIAGPAVATGLVLTVGGAWAFALDAATFVVSAVTLLGVQARPRGEPGLRSGLLGELVEGWTAVRERAWVWATIAGFSVAVLVALAPFFVLGAAVSRDVYGTDAVYGVVNTVWGVGTVLGALGGARWRPRHPMRTGLLLGLLWPGALGCLGLGLPLPLLYPMTALAGLGLGFFGVWWETALAQRIPPHLLSRVSAWDVMGSLALLPLGYLLAGPVGALLGEARVLAVGGLIGTAAMVLTLVPRSTRELRRFEAAPEGQREVSTPAVRAPG